MIKLDAINTMLQAIGVQAISTLEGTNPDKINAVVVLDRVSSAFQSKPGYYNSEVLTLTPDINGNIFVPSNTLTVNPVSKRTNVTVRNFKLYNLVQQSYIFDSPIEVTIVFNINFDFLPFVVQNIIQYMAAMEMQSLFEVDQLKMSYITSKITEARILYTRENIIYPNSNSLLTNTVLRLNNRSRRYRF